MLKKMFKFLIFIFLLISFTNVKASVPWIDSKTFGLRNMYVDGPGFKESVPGEPAFRINNEIAYCADPRTQYDTDTSHDYTKQSVLNDYISQEQLDKIALYQQYFQNNENTKSEWYFYTQAIIWNVLHGDTVSFTGQDGSQYQKAVDYYEKNKTKYKGEGSYWTSGGWQPLIQVNAIPRERKCDYSIDISNATCPDSTSNESTRNISSTGIIQQTTDWECIFKSKHLIDTEENEDPTSANYFYQKNNNCEMMCREKISYNFPNNIIYASQGSYFTVGEVEDFKKPKTNIHVPDWGSITMTATKECRLINNSNANDCMLKDSANEDDWFNPKLVLSYNTSNKTYDFEDKYVFSNINTKKESNTLDYNKLSNESEFKSDYTNNYNLGYYIKVTKTYNLNKGVYAYADSRNGISKPNPNIDNVSTYKPSMYEKPVSGNLGKLLGNLPVSKTEPIGSDSKEISLKIVDFGLKNANQLKDVISSGTKSNKIYTELLTDKISKNQEIYEQVVNYLENISDGSKTTNKLYTFLHSSCAIKYSCEISGNNIKCSKNNQLYDCMKKVAMKDEYVCPYNVVKCPTVVSDDGDIPCLTGEYNKLKEGDIVECKKYIKNWKETAGDCSDKCKVVRHDQSECAVKLDGKYSWADNNGESYSLVKIEENCIDNTEPIYRQINLSNPFPSVSGSGRITGSNWCTDTSCKNNNELVKETILKTGDTLYQRKPIYTIELDVAKMQKIRKYNENHSFDDFIINCTNGEKCFSEFLSTVLDGGTCANAKNANYYSCANKKNPSD